MAITDTLTTIKDYFINWHDKYYDEIHLKTTNFINDKINNLTASQVKDTTKNQTTQQTLDAYGTSINNNATDITNIKNTYASVGGLDGIAGYQADWRGFNPKATGTRQNGLMHWYDKAQLVQLGTWYEVHRSDHASLGEHMTLWVNPALRICYLKWAYKGFTVNQWDNIYSDSAEWDWYSQSSDSFLDHCAPISPIWAPTNVPHINIGIDTTARFYVRSSEKPNKTYTIVGSLFWFYRDNNFIGTNSAGRWQ